MKKHKFNIFPEAKPDDYSRLLEDIRGNGFDQTQPITIFESEILDGWNRFRACAESGVAPKFTTFTGSDSDAIAFVMRTNKRRNLGSGQWAAIAVEAEELMAAIRGATEDERRTKISANNGNKPTEERCNNNLLHRKKRDPNENATPTKAAELFNTNRTYVNQANKIKEAAPETFEKLKAGKISMQDAQKEVRKKPTDDWRLDERERQGQVKDGETVIANYEKDKNLIAWAESIGVAVSIDRSSRFGNPFIEGVDGDRDFVCDAFERFYLPHKPSILSRAAELKGKVLCCHCYPLRCHGDTLAVRVVRGVRE